MADLKPKVSTVVRSQLPDYVQSGYEAFTDFVSMYYQWMEQEQNPNFFLHNAIEQKDIDTAMETFADLHAKEFIRSYQDLNIDRKLLVKNIKDFFKAKGSLPSFEFLFQVFFDEPVELEYGRDKILRPSDIEPDTRVLVFIDDVVGDPFMIQGSFLYQPATGVRGFVDLVAEVTVDGNSLWQLVIDDTKLSGDFDDRQEVWAYYREDLGLAVDQRRKCSGIIQPIIGKINIIKSGPGYVHGDPIGFIDPIKQEGLKGTGWTDVTSSTLVSIGTGTKTFVANKKGNYEVDTEIKVYYDKNNYMKGLITSIVENGNGLATFTLRVDKTKGSGQYQKWNFVIEPTAVGMGATAYIDSVTPGSVDNLRITRTGSGYKVGDKIYNHDSIEDTGIFEGEVSVVDGYGCKIQPVLGLDEWKIQNSGYGYKVNDLVHFYPNKTQAATLRVVSVKDTDLLYDVNIPNGGVGYQYVALGVYDESNNFMQRVWCTTSKDARGSLKDITFDLKDPRNGPAPWINTHSYVPGDQFQSGGKWYRVLYSYTSGSVFGALDTANTFQYGPRTDGFDLDGYADQIYVNGYGASILPITTGNSITSYVVEAPGMNYVQPVLYVNGSATGTVNVAAGYLGAGITSVTGGGMLISTAMSTVSDVNVGDTFFSVAVTDISKWREGWSVYSTAFSTSNNVARIESISYDSDINKYVVVVSNPLQSVVTSMKIQQVEVTVKERYGYGASVTGLYKTGAIRELAVVDHGQFTAIDRQSFTTTTAIVPQVTATTISGNGTEVVFTFDNKQLAAQYGRDFIPFPIGSSVTISGVVPTQYNGTFVVNSAGPTSFGVLRTVTTTVTTLGQIKRVDPMGRGTGLVMRGYYSMLYSNVLNPGVGYTKPVLSLNQAFGEGAEWEPIVANDAITNVTLSNPGAGYINPILKVKESYGHGFDFKSRLELNDNGGIERIVITDPGYDYVDITAADLEIVGTCTQAAIISGVTTTDTTIRKIVIYNGGYNFYHDMVFEQTGGPGTGSTFEVEVTETGVINSILPVTYGTGYTDASTFQLKASDRILRSNMAADLWIPFIDSYWPVIEEAGIVDLNPKFDYSYLPGIGISAINLTNGGSGYWAPTEVMPIELTVIDPTGNGSGAQLLPMIDTLAGDAGESPTRSISGVVVARGGQDYSANTYIKIVGGVGTGAQLQPIIENGEIVDVVVMSGGGDYYYGTKAIIIGDGTGANASVEVDTGIYVEILNPGRNYLPAHPPVIAITDERGVGAKFQCVVNSAGQVTSVTAINRGTGYLSPQMQIVHNGGSDFDAVVYVRRNIKSINLTSKGSKYSTARIFVQGDGFGAAATPVILNSGVTTVKVPYGGCRISAYPEIVVTDTALEGKISQVKIIRSTNNFKEVPSLYIESQYGVNGEVIALSNTIGRVKEIKVTSPGYGYETKPYVATPIILRTDESVLVKRGEVVYVPDYNYPIVNGKPDYKQGPHGYIADYEPSKNLVKITPETESITLLSEGGSKLIGEIATARLASEASYEWNGLVKTAITGMDLTIPYDAARCYGVVDVTGQFEKIEYDIRSLLNTDRFRLHNNLDIQEYAYTVVTGLDIREYKKLVKEYLHPAGYELAGKIKFNLIFDVSMNHEVIEDAPGGRFLISITIDLTGDDQRGTVTHTGRKEFNITINLDTQRVKIYAVKDPYFNTNLFAYKNKLSYEPAFMWEPTNFKTSDRKAFVATDYYTPWLPKANDLVAEKARLKTMIQTVLGRSEAVAEAQATAALPLAYPAATPIGLFENMTIAQMDNPAYSYFSEKHNWARDTNVLINMPRYKITGDSTVIEGATTTFTITPPVVSSTSYTMNIVTGFTQRAVSEDINSAIVVKDNLNNVLTGTNGNYTVPANATYLTVDVTTINDRSTNGWEGVSEIFELNVYAVHPTLGRCYGRKTMRVIEPMLYIVPNTPTITEGGTAIFTITVPTSTVDQQVKIMTFVNAPGFNYDEADYADILPISVYQNGDLITGTNYIYTLPANQTTLVVNINTNDDQVVEIPEKLYLKAWSTLPQTTRSLFASAKVTIIDND